MQLDEHDFLMNVLRGDEAAVDFCQLIYRISQKVDDLYDGDKPVHKDGICLLIWECIIQLPAHPFYIRNFNTLHPLIQAAYIDWMDANLLEKEDDHTQSIAFVLRDTVGTLAVHVAYLVGGYAWGREVGPKIRKFIHDESLKDYKEGLKS